MCHDSSSFARKVMIMSGQRSGNILRKLHNVLTGAPSGSSGCVRDEYSSLYRLASRDVETSVVDMDLDSVRPLEEFRHSGTNLGGAGACC